MKIIIFSHESDIDGLGCIVLGKLAFDSMDYCLRTNPYLLEEKFREYLESGALYKYDKIFVTDLALQNPSLEIVSKDPILSKKVLVFDHHKSAIDAGYDKYDFTTIQETDENGIKTCGTKLFYDYLVKNNLITKTKILDDFVELTRLYDTWDWKNDKSRGIMAHDLSLLLNIIGIENYIEHMFLRVLSGLDKFSFTNSEVDLIETRKQEYAVRVREIWSSAEYLTDEFGNKCAVVFASIEYIGDLCEYVRGIDGIDIKYFILIDLDKLPLPQKSYRQIEEGFDVSKIAALHGGGGHPAASAVPISDVQKEKALVLLKNNKIDGLKYLVESDFKK